MNGSLWWQQMELYNDVARQVAREQSVFLIDLARQMPKSSAFFYDHIHFTNAGTSLISDLMSEQLIPWLESNFANYRQDNHKQIRSDNG